MKWRSALHLRAIIPGVFIVFAAVVGLYITVERWGTTRSHIERDHRVMVNYLMSELQGNVDARMADRSLDILQQQISDLSTIPQVTALLVTDETGKVLLSNQYAWAGRQADKISGFDPVAARAVIGQQQAKTLVAHDGTLIQGYYPVTLGQSSGELRPSRFGALYLEYDLSLLFDEARSEVERQALVFWALVATLAAALFTLIHRRVTLRVEKIAAALDGYATGDMDSRAGIEGDDEIARLGRGFDDMAQKLKLDREALRESERYLLRLLDNLPVAVVVHGPDAAIKFANPVALAFLGIDDERLRGKSAFLPDWHFIRDDGSSMPVADYPVNRVIASRQALKDYVVGVMRGQSSAPAWAYVNAYPEVDAQGQLLEVLVCFVDITRLRYAEAEIRALNQGLERRVMERTAQLQAANSDLESFSYSVSHDLRAPLRAIDGFSMILTEDYAASLDAEGNRLLNLVRSNTQKMGQLIDDILAFSRAGRKMLDLSLIDMAQMARAVFDDLKPEIRGREVELRLARIEPCRGDRAMIRQVWTNLLDNAVKFTRGQAHALIEVGCRVEGDETVYYVKDNGAGFDMQYSNKLFGVFQRLHTDEAFEGTGVGLAMVKRIVDKHGGRVWAESSPQMGATFYFALPGNQAEPKAQESI